MRAILFAIAIMLGLVTAVTGAEAGSVDHERARAAMESGQILPLSQILLKVEKAFDGRVIEVKLTDIDAGLYGWVYALTLLTPQNNVLLLKIDAGTAVLLQVRGKGIEEARKAP